MGLCPKCHREAAVAGYHDWYALTVSFSGVGECRYITCRQTFGIRATFPHASGRRLDAVERAAFSVAEIEQGLQTALIRPSTYLRSPSCGGSVGEKSSPNAAYHSHHGGESEIEPKMVIGPAQAFSHHAAH